MSTISKAQKAQGKVVVKAIIDHKDNKSKASVQGIQPIESLLGGTTENSKQVLIDDVNEDTAEAKSLSPEIQANVINPNFLDPTPSPTSPQSCNNNVTASHNQNFASAEIGNQFPHQNAYNSSQDRTNPFNQPMSTNPWMNIPMYGGMPPYGYNPSYQAMAPPYPVAGQIPPMMPYNYDPRQMWAGQYWRWANNPRYPQPLFTETDFDHYLRVTNSPPRERYGKPFSPIEMQQNPLHIYKGTTYYNSSSREANVQSAPTDHLILQ